MDIRILVHMLLKLFSYECLQNEFATFATKYTNGWIMNMNHFKKIKTSKYGFKTVFMFPR
jgi:hypothetical protein